MPPVKPGSAIGHTARYLADKIRARKASQEKRKAERLLDTEEDQLHHAAKRVRQGTEEVTPQQIEDLKVKALKVWTEQIPAGTDNIYKKLYGQDWEEGKKYELEKLAQKQAEHKRRQEEFEAAHADRLSSWEKAHHAVTDSGIYKDDYDPRY